MKKLALLTLFCSLATGVIAAPNDGWNEAMTVFKAGSVDGKNGFRIPAITSTGNGSLVAATDYRYKNKDWNTDMGTTQENPNPYFIVKISNDGGNTWFDSKLELPTLKNPTTGKEEAAITDPSLVYNQNTGTTFLFGYNNTKHIAVEGGDSAFFVYSSEDGGKTWSTYKDIKSEILEGLKQQNVPSDKYENILQGPGSGITFNNTVYMPIQLFNEGNSWGGDYTSTTGFIYSEDNGKTWKTSTLLDSLQGAENLNLQESNIFIQNGEIYLASKNGSHDPKNPNSSARVVYKTNDNGKTWTLVKEDFLPDNIATCETASLSLSNNVYLVSYSTVDDKNERNNTYVTTNTGKKIQILDGPTYGYTSMTQDEDNLYILFETAQGKADINMRRFDISAKEYANINTQVLNRGTDLLDIQDKLFASRSYLSGEYATHDNSGVEAVILNGNYKIGAFHKNTKENSKDVYRTIEYNTEDTTLVLSQDNVITNSDNIFAGYQYTKLSYVNGSKNNINSFVMGYSLNHTFENDFGYNLGINGVYSNNKLDRNEAEGLGKSASFDSYSISLKNEFYKNIQIQESTNLNLATGLKTTYFGHDKIREKEGNGFNDAYINRAGNFSNELYLKANAEYNMQVTEKFIAKLGTDIGYSKELMNIDDWRDDFTILDVEKEYARPVEKHNGGIANAGLYLTLDFADKIETTLAYTFDSNGEGITTGKLTYKF